VCLRSGPGRGFRHQRPHLPLERFEMPVADAERAQMFDRVEQVIGAAAERAGTRRKVARGGFLAQREQKRRGFFDAVAAD